jgi:hypothetical protein
VSALVELAAHLGFEVSRRDRVDPDAFAGGPLLCQVSCQAERVAAGCDCHALG